MIRSHSFVLKSSYEGFAALSISITPQKNLIFASIFCNMNHIFSKDIYFCVDDRHFDGRYFCRTV